MEMTYCELNSFLFVVHYKLWCSSNTFAAFFFFSFLFFFFVVDALSHTLTIAMVTFGDFD